MKQVIDFVSPSDGSHRRAVLIAPPDAADRALPLAIVPHAAGYSAEATAAYWRDLPVRRGAIAVFPFGHGRDSELYSMGSPAQIADLASMPDVVASAGLKVDHERVYAIGISMGGQEALLLAGRRPGLLSAVVAFNVAVDLSVWYYETDLGKRILDAEIGGPPADFQAEYSRRSPLSYAAEISRTPTLLAWDPADEVVPRQEEAHCGRLYRKLMETADGADIESMVHHRGHFWVNPGMALRWAMEHGRPGHAQQ